jgi:hypothetical protein
METIETEWEGVKLKGIVAFRDEWSYRVKLMEPVVSWQSGCHIPTFARGSGRDNYLGKYGETSMQKTLIELYQKSKRFYGLVPRLQLIYKDYCEEIALLDSVPMSRARERIRHKITDEFMDFIFGKDEWTIDDSQGVLKILNGED